MARQVISQHTLLLPLAITPDKFPQHQGEAGFLRLVKLMLKDLAVVPKFQDKTSVLLKIYFIKYFQSRFLSITLFEITFSYSYLLLNWRQWDEQGRAVSDISDFGANGPRFGVEAGLWAKVWQLLEIECTGLEIWDRFCTFSWLGKPSNEITGNSSFF